MRPLSPASPGSLGWRFARARCRNKPAVPVTVVTRPVRKGWDSPRMGSGGASPMGEGVLHRFRKNATEALGLLDELEKAVRALLKAAA